jgi:hypothetical protein
MLIPPFILAGPIVRRVTPTVISVWVALSEKAAVTLSIWDKVVSTGDGLEVFDAGTDLPLHTSSPQATTQIGKKLHVCICTISLPPEQTLLPGKLYSYNLKFKKKDNKVVDLKSAGLLENTTHNYIIQTIDWGNIAKILYDSEAVAEKLQTALNNPILVPGDRLTGFPDTLTENNIEHSLKYEELSPNLALGYQEGNLPTFTLPPLNIESYKLAHGSCRRIHGTGKDALAALDFIIKKAVINNVPDIRPHQLFLTGDQIYADDIPTLVLPTLNTLGSVLLGVKENLTAKTYDANDMVSTIPHEITLTNFPATRRKPIVVYNAKFSTEDGENHLLSFGEFAAAYLMGWSNAVWPVELYAGPEELKSIEDYLASWNGISGSEYIPKTEVEGKFMSIEDIEDFENSLDKYREEKIKIISKDKLKENQKQSFINQLERIAVFRTQLPYVRRLLANIPVYMIMDDHEVTDDWNVSQHWRDRVLTSPLGVNILRNALMAYAIFQDWGNDPLAYNPQTWLKEHSYNLGEYVKPPSANDHIYRVSQSGKTGSEPPDWPTAQGESFIDGSVKWEEAGIESKQKLLTELQKVFAGDSGPELEPANAIDRLFGFDLNDETPPPVRWHYSVPASETKVYVLDTRTRRTFQTRHSPPGLLSKSAMRDQIPQNPQPEPFLVFVSPAPVLGLAVIEGVLQPLKTIFNGFDGDPEPWSFDTTAFEELLNQMQKFKRVIFLSGDVHYGISSVLDYWKKDDILPARFVQFVSSSLKNKKFTNDKFLTSGFAQKLMDSHFYPTERMGWTHRVGLQVTNPSGNRPLQRIALRKEPVLLSTQGWPVGTTINPGPDWSWRLRLLSDERPESERPQNIQIQEIVDGDYKKVLERHTDIFRKGIARKIEWDTNVGIITFSRDNQGSLTTLQELMRWLPEDSFTEDPDAYMVHRCSLEPTPDEAPKIVREA